MIEFHDHDGGEHDHVPLSGDDATADHAADRFADHPAPPLDDLTSADAPPELHFPGDVADHTASAADLDPAAPWPDDAGFAQWLGAHEAGDAATDPGDGIADGLAAPPDGAGGLPPVDELVDWTLRQLDAD